jgi:hypothetical protein
MAGARTTFVISTRNDASIPALATLEVQVEPALQADWSVELSVADDLFRPVGGGSPQVFLALQPQETAHIVASLRSSLSLPEGAEGNATIVVKRGGAVEGSLTLRARIRNRPKVYFVTLDACGRNYLELGRNGETYGGIGERLMPNSVDFVTDAAFLSQARAVLPATTDVNHMAAMTGSWAGTLGIYSIRQHYVGLRRRKPITVVGSKSLLRWGDDGAPVVSIFDVAKDRQSGGDPEVFNAMMVGKAWMGDYFQDDIGTVDLIGSGKSYPDYIPAPEPFRLGDPVSDPDAETDRDGTNLGPRFLMRRSSPLARQFGQKPAIFPDDRWVAEAAVRIISVEDPDYFYVILPEIDTVQHVFGAADDPSVWDDRGTPDVLWDDVNVFNPRANRSPILDVVYEADRGFGLITDLLKSRGTYDDSLVILLSDHGASTVSEEPDSIIDVGTVLSENGMTTSQIERFFSSAQMTWIALTNPNDAVEAERILEGYMAPDPMTGNLTHPFLVVTRPEMDTGVDARLGVVAEDGIQGNGRGELYSAWSIDRPATDNSKVRWADLLVFTLQPFQAAVNKSSVIDDDESDFTIYIGNHAAPGTADVILAIRGPGVRRGRFQEPVSLVDVTPTVYEILGLSRPANVDGRALGQILLN